MILNCEVDKYTLITRLQVNFTVNTIFHLPVKIQPIIICICTAERQKTFPNEELKNLSSIIVSVL